MKLENLPKSKETKDIKRVGRDGKWECSFIFNGQDSWTGFASGDEWVFFTDLRSVPPEMSQSGREQSEQVRIAGGFHYVVNNEKHY